ncbi:MAG: hypothetical protein J6V53_02000 [Alphaproteobacteria bacterium]|nr:hypothetical protein [Alphaproteobacteria bacterium]
MNKEIQKMKDSLVYSGDDVKYLEKKAQKVIDDLRGSFVTEANDFVCEMSLLLEQAMQLDKNERTFLLKNRFFNLAHDLKGQGTTYGFELVTVLADHICGTIRQKRFFSQKEMDVFLLDVLDMKKVLSEPPYGISSGLKKQIINRLEKAKCLK